MNEIQPGQQTLVPYTMKSLNAVFLELKAILQPYAEQLDVKVDTDSELYIDTHHIQKNKKPLFFGTVQIKMNYVSYYLMPVYVDPGLLDGISAKLKKRMQGKSCFNFSEIDRVLFEELGQLTEAGFASYKEQDFI
jgi:hypothetical protein